MRKPPFSYFSDDENDSDFFILGKTLLNNIISGNVAINCITDVTEKFAEIPYLPTKMPPMKELPDHAAVLKDSKALHFPRSSFGTESIKTLWVRAWVQFMHTFRMRYRIHVIQMHVEGGIS